MTKRGKRSMNTVMIFIGRSYSLILIGLLFTPKQESKEKAIRIMNTKLQITEYRMEHIDHTYYINLEHRRDRKEQFEKEMSSFDIDASKITRISAISIPQLGILGCAVSHIQALETFLQSSFTTCMILEDDFQWKVDREYLEFLLLPVSEEKIPFDCILLAGNVEKSEPTEWPFLRRILDAQTTAGYIITREFAPVLRDNLIESVQRLS